MLDPMQRSFPSAEFWDVLEANRAFASTFDTPNATGPAAKGLAIVTCMDARIDPLAVVGMRVGDAKILRNPGARVTEDVPKRPYTRRYSTLRGLIPVRSRSARCRINA